MPVPLFQVRGDLLSRLALREGVRRPAAILFGVIGRVLPRLHDWLRSDRRLQDRWSRALGVDCSDDRSVADLLLREALVANADGAVLFSTTSPVRLERACATAQYAVTHDAAVDRFRTLVAAALPADQAQP